MIYYYTYRCSDNKLITTSIRTTSLCPRAYLCMIIKKQYIIIFQGIFITYTRSYIVNGSRRNFRTIWRRWGLHQQDVCFFFGLSLLPPDHQLFVTGEHHTIFYYIILYIPIYYNNTLIVNDERCFFFRLTGRIKIVKLSSTLQRYIAKPNILNYYYYCLKRRCTEVLIIITTTRSHNRSLGLKFIASTSHRRRRSIYIAVGPIFNGLPFYPFFFRNFFFHRVFFRLIPQTSTRVVVSRCGSGLCSSSSSDACTRCCWAHVLSSISTQWARGIFIIIIIITFCFFFRSPTLIRIRIIVGIGMLYSRCFITHIIILLYTGIQYNTILLLL